MVKSDIPFGSEFSPTQIELEKVLEIAINSTDWHNFEDQIRSEYFETRKISDYNKGKLANNCKLSMQAYGIIDTDANLTDFGKKLYSQINDEDELISTLAKHILLNLYGLTVIECLKDMEAAGEKITLTKLRIWLKDRGINFPRGGKHPSVLRLWLEKAGIFYPNSWRVNDKRLQDILGTTYGEIEELSTFSEQQRAFILTLVNIDSPDPVQSNEIEKLATTAYGTKFDEKNLPKQVLYPLEKKGYITLTRGTKKKGRGAKPFFVECTKKLEKDIIEPILKQLDKQVHIEIRPYLRKTFTELLIEIDLKDTYLKGLALEALAFKLMRLLNLQYVATRLMGSQTGGAEVDLIFESLNPTYLIWQVQCKNTKTVRLNDVAKEVGIAPTLNSNIIVIISTGKIGSETRRFANNIMGQTNLIILLIDGEDIQAIKDNPTVIRDIIYRESKHANNLKKIELSET